MTSYSLSHLTDHALLDSLKEARAREIKLLGPITAEVLSHIAEVDDRKLYREAGYSSMLDYCVHELDLSHDAANKRIQAARKARDFPAIFQALADTTGAST